MSNQRAPSPQPIPDVRPIDHLVELAGERGDEEHTALVLRDKMFDHAELRHRVAVLAGWLKRKLGEPGARVASWAAKGELTCLLPLAAARAGMVHVPINPLLKRAQAAHILTDSGASLLIGTKARLASLAPDDLPGSCLVLEESETLAMAEAAGAMLEPSDAPGDALAAILYTSGSTGQPKGVLLSHANLWLGAVSVAHYLKLASDDVTLAVLPLSFDYGQSQLLSTWYAGGAVVPLDYLFARDVMKACERHGITTLAAVPPLWVQLAELDWPVQATGSLRRLTNSGGALSRELVKNLRALAPGAELVPMYGLTEAFRSTYLDPALVDTHPTSMGRAIPFAEILVINDVGELAQAEEEGELVHCGPLVAQGYWRDPERTARRFRPAPAASQYGGIAVWSGDRVRRDADGLLYFAGRRDAMIKSSGNRISPHEIENTVLSLDAIAEAIALGVPDERLGEAIHLVVRGEETEETRAALAKLLARELPGFMQPRKVHWRAAMPLNPNGKIDRTALLHALATEEPNQP